MEADNETDQPTRPGASWDFAAVDTAGDPQSFVRYLQQRPGGEALDLLEAIGMDSLDEKCARNRTLLPLFRVGWKVDKHVCGMR